MNNKIDFTMSGLIENNKGGITAEDFSLRIVNIEGAHFLKVFLLGETFVLSLDLINERLKELDNG